MTRHKTPRKAIRSLILLLAVMCGTGGAMAAKTSATQAFRPPAVPLITVDPVLQRVVDGG